MPDSPPLIVKFEGGIKWHSWDGKRWFAGDATAQTLEWTRKMQDVAKNRIAAVDRLAADLPEGCGDWNVFPEEI